MPPRRCRLLEDRPLRGLAPNPQPWYLDAVRPLAPDDHRPPDQRSDEELRPYCLSVRQEKQVAESTVRLHLDGSRFCYARTLTRPWPVFDRGRPRNIPKLPVVLSPRAGRDLLAVVTNPTAQRCLRLSYACGRRRREGPPRQVADIDPQRMRVPVRQGNGGQERVGPLAPRVLAWLRGCWPRQRPRPWGCPARPRSGPLSPTARPTTLNAVGRPSGLANDAASPPRRHSSAPPLLERGGALRVIQARLGPKSPRTTARYAPLTPPTLAVVHAPINALMADLSTPRRPAMPEGADVLRR